MKIKNIAGINVITVDEGKHFVNLEETDCGMEIWLGKEDSIDNYKEVDIVAK